MDYWKLKGENYIVILFEYYIESLNYGNRENKRNKHFIKSSYLKELIDDLGEIKENFIFFDMKYIYKAASRVFSFLKGEDILKKIVFFNIQKGCDIYKYINTDLHGKNMELSGSEIIYFSDEAIEQYKKADISDKYQKLKINILTKYVNKEITLLASSGVYSNMSLDYKSMFECPEDIGFIISELYYMILCIEQEQRIDFLVAASKNAIALTSILSNRLEKPAIYHTNIGQKYVKQKFTDKVKNRVDIVQEEKKYLMVFDVICLGTEARILNGIINALGGNLVGAVGLVCVQDPKAMSELDNDSILAKAWCMTTTKGMELEYRIALTREELEGDNNAN